MQSFLQYRRFGRLIHEQLQRDNAKQEDSGDTRIDGSNAAPLHLNNTSGYSRNIDNDDPEKAAGAPIGITNGQPKQILDASEYRGRDPVNERDGLSEEDYEREEEVDSSSGDQIHAESSAAQLHGDTEKTIEPIRHGPRVSSRASSRARRTLSRLSTTKTNQSIGTGLGHRLTGIDVRDRTTNEGGDVNRQVFVVGWHGEDDPMNPHNWSTWTRIGATFNVAAIGAVVGFASSIDASILVPASEEFGVSPVVESMATGLYLAGFGAGALFAGPISETLGRNPVYISTLSLYMIFIMASGLAPNIGAQLVFRFLAGFFGSTPLTCAGGTIADIWSPLERVWAFPVFAQGGFSGPLSGPIIGGFIAQSTVLSWRWTEWITLIISGLVLTSVTLFQPETYSGVILTWKAKHLRNKTGDDRYAAPMEVRDEKFTQRLRTALYRPFLLTSREPIIMLIALYLTVIYIILFTFLDGYTYIFADIHGTSPGITGVCFLGLIIGLYFACAMVPLIYRWAKRDLKKIHEQGGQNLPPEFRLWFCMLGGSISLPIALFWMGWTSDPNISIWSPIAASVFVGYSILCIFISSYMYIIDSYEIYSASALASVTLIRYVVSGGMVVVGIPFYKNLGVHFTLTILGCFAALMAPVPYVFYKYGPKIRAMSKYAVTEKG